MVEVVGQVYFSFLVTLGYWVTRILLENWQTKFWDSEPIVARFPSNTHGTLGVWIPHNSFELNLTPCMCIVCHMRGLSSSRMSKQNVLSLFLLIPLTKLTNQKKGNCRHLIWYPLMTQASVPQWQHHSEAQGWFRAQSCEIWLERLFLEKKKCRKNPKHASAYTRMRKHTWSMCTHT